jgi:hypothetical protein
LTSGYPAQSLTHAPQQLNWIMAVLYYVHAPQQLNWIMAVLYYVFAPQQLNWILAVLYYVAAQLDLGCPLLRLLRGPLLR